MAQHAQLRTSLDGAGVRIGSWRERWGERLAELGAVPSVGSVGDSYDCDVMVGLPGRV